MAVAYYSYCRVGRYGIRRGAVHQRSLPRCSLFCSEAVSIYLAALAVLFYFLWLREAVPSLLAGEIPKSIQDNGTPTNAVHVLDMAWILPAFGITAVSLRRKQALGYLLAGVLLSYGVLLILAVLSMAVFMIREGHAVAVPQVVIFGALFPLSLGMLIWYMKGLKSPADREPSGHEQDSQMFHVL